MPIYDGKDGVVVNCPKYPTSKDGVVLLADYYTSKDGVIERIFTNFKELKKWYVGCTLSGSWFGGRHGNVTNNENGLQNPTSNTTFCNFTSTYIYLYQALGTWINRGVFAFNQKFTKDTKYLHITCQAHPDGSVFAGLVVDLFSSWTNAMDYRANSDVSGEEDYTPPIETFTVSGTDIWIDVNVDGRNTGKSLFVEFTAYTKSQSGSIIITSISFTNRK